MRASCIALVFLLASAQLSAQCEPWLVTSHQRYGGGYGFGANLGFLGDLDGDDDPEFACGVPDHMSPSPLCGGVQVVSARSSQTRWFVAGPHQEARLGAGLALCPDRNGDGIPDLVASCTVAGSGAGGFGTELRLYSGADGTLLDQIPLAQHAPLFPRTTLTIAGDRDGDGIPEVIVTPLQAAGDPRVHLVVVDLVQRAPIRDLALPRSALPGTSLSYDALALKIADDRTGDGIPELLLGYPAFRSDAGQGFIEMIDGDSGLPLRQRAAVPGTLSFGSAFAFTADETGDGIPELAVGACDLDSLVGVFPLHGADARVALLDGASWEALSLLTPPDGMRGFGAALASVDGGNRLFVGGDPSNATWLPSTPVITATELRRGSEGWERCRLFVAPAEDVSIGVVQLAVGDVNRDGATDLLVATPGKGWPAITSDASVSAYFTPRLFPFGAGDPSVHRLELLPLLCFRPPLHFALGIDNPESAALPYLLVVGSEGVNLPFHGGTLLVDLGRPFASFGGTLAPLSITTVLDLWIPDPVVGIELWIQAGALMPTAPQGVLLSDGLRLTL